MARSRFALARTSWLATPRPTRRAVEKPEPWTPWKTNPRFSPAPTAPWKTRKGSEFPTFPPPRRFLLFLQSKTKGEEDSMKTRPDNYRVNKTGQLKKLTTAGGDTRGATHAGGDTRGATGTVSGFLYGLPTCLSRRDVFPASLL